MADYGNRTWASGDRHWGFGPGDTTAPVDVLIPGEWFAPGSPVGDLPLTRYDESIAHPGKIVACGPYNGYVQYSIRAVGADDPEDVRVSVEDDLTHLVIEVRPSI